MWPNPVAQVCYPQLATHTCQLLATQKQGKQAQMITSHSEWLGAVMMVSGPPKLWVAKGEKRRFCLGNEIWAPLALLGPRQISEQIRLGFSTHPQPWSVANISTTTDAGSALEHR